MSPLKFRIGTKLGIAAAVGVLLLAAMVGNQVRTHFTTLKLADDVKRTTTLSNLVMETDVDLRQLTIEYQAVRLAGTPAEVDAQIKRIEETKGHFVSLLDRGLAVSVTELSRTKLASTKEFIVGYAAALLEVADAQKELIAIRDRQQKEGLDWPGRLNALLTMEAMTAQPNAAEIIRTLEHSDSAFKQARLVAWAKLVRADDTQATRMNASFNEALKLLTDARNMAADDRIKRDIDRLPPIINQFRALVENVQVKFERAAVINAEKADPLREKAHALTNQLNQLLQSRTAETQVAAEAEAGRLLWINTGAGAAILLVLIGSAVFSNLNIARPIRRIGDVLLELATGNKSVEIPYIDRGDEVGDAARAANTFRDNLVRVETMEADRRHAEARTAADKTAAAEREAADKRAAEERVALERNTARHRLADAFEATVGGIVETVSKTASQLEMAAGTLTKTAETTQHLSATVASASEQASANVRSVASSTDEMSSSVDEIGRQVQQSSRIALQAVKQAQATDARINSLSHAASRIGDVVKLITAVAEQTNLLALNATIEAARAGESGRGFAVVASEVKALAAQTAKATEEIGSQIAGMQTETAQAVTAIKEIGGTIDQISQIAATIASAVEQQGAATQEIARNVQQAAQGTTEVATSITDVNRGASETGLASTHVLASARSLSKDGGMLKAEVERFLATVRAA
jgi:methyl-accepting chemotaxis protein